MGFEESGAPKNVRQSGIVARIVLFVAPGKEPIQPCRKKPRASHWYWAAAAPAVTHISVSFAPSKNEASKSGFEFNRAEEMADLGYEKTTRALDELAL